MDRRGFLGFAAGSAWDGGARAERITPPAGGRLTRSTTEYLANNAVFNVLDFGARRDGSDDGPAIRRAMAAANAAQGSLVFPAGTYSYTNSPNFAAHDLEILGQGRVTLRHTGRGVGFLVDGWVRRHLGRRVWNMRIENLVLEGNAETTIGFYFRSVHHGRFSRLRVIGGAPSGEGFRTEFFIANYCEAWCVTANERVVGVLPGTGITLSSLAPPLENRGTVDCTMVNFIVEGCANVGVHLDRAQHNLIRGGTFEDNKTGTGLVLSEAASGNSIDGVFLESNRLHIDCRGPQNQFVAVSAEKGLSRFHGNANFSRLIGGRYADLAILGVRDVKLLGIAVRRMADRGLRTQRLGCHDMASDLPMPDHDGARVPSRRWQAPKLAAPWANAGGDATPAGFRRDPDGTIRLRGRLTRAGGKAGKRRLPLVVFTLPEDCRPTHRHRFPVLSRGKLGVLEVEVGGNVVLLKGAVEDLSLDGVVIVEDRPA